LNQNFEIFPHSGIAILLIFIFFLFIFIDFTARSLFVNDQQPAQNLDLLTGRIFVGSICFSKERTVPSEPKEKKTQTLGQTRFPIFVYQCISTSSFFC